MKPENQNHLYNHLYNRILRCAGAAAMLAALGIGAPAMAQEADALESVAASDKLIRIRHADDEGGGGSGPEHAGKFRVDIRAGRSSYRAGEAIRFKVRGNNEFYLYMINIDPRTGRAVAILPNRLQTHHKIKYPGDGRWYVVPNENLEFYSDRAGHERIIMVASERYLDVDRLLSKSRSKSVGDFYEMEAPLDALDDAIGESYGDKAIRIRNSGDGDSGRGRGHRLPRGIVIKEMNLRIR
ncbi:MAG: DUF4384 domain-containing protein [Gammaproteobacteria bacterium]|nr:DUF4384 domain-containing protein [Gammaproteobacteria bacterium]MBU1655025.1 DUF4384 domain-containing protein [Gammaproteobacteria bacterium]MBU1961522.1 DUF4384 domain-containing protein [Gammaproteobacteria bacterium]